ncbi:MAG: DUF3052 domain-containing protein [Gemmatimonadales bacterium]
MPAGYSGTPLPDKLGIKRGVRVVVLGAPWRYGSVVTPLPPEVRISARLGLTARFVHLFARRESQLRRALPRAAVALSDDGMLWVSWPKKTSGVATDLTENRVRELGLANGLVDVKVCAVDEMWSGLKFVRRLRDRRGSFRLPLGRGGRGAPGGTGAGLRPLFGPN